MANICITDYRVLGDQDVLRRIKDAINSESSYLVGTIRNWAGNTLAQLDISPDDAGRAWWNDARIVDGVLYFWEEGAWSRSNAIKLLQNAYPELDIVFKTEEFGCGIFETNDHEGRFFTEKYMLYEEDIDDTYFDSFKELVDYLNEHYPELSSCDDVESINDYFDDNDICSQVHEIEYVSYF